MLFADLDVLISDLAWPPVFLVAYPRAQDRLVQEIRADLTLENVSIELSALRSLHCGCVLGLLICVYRKKSQ